MSHTRVTRGAPSSDSYRERGRLIIQVRRAAGVSDVETDGSTLRCLVSGSFQPFLEALRGHEVVRFDSAPASTGTGPGAA